MLNCKIVAIFYALLSGIAVAVIYHREGYLIADYYIGQKSMLEQLAWGFSSAVSFSVVWAVARRFLQWAQNIETVLREILGKSGIARVMCFAFCSGIGEEIFFRGAIQPYLGLVGTSILFGVLHWIPTPEGWIYALVATTMGFVFGGLMIYCGGLVAPTVAHILINMINIYIITNTAKDNLGQTE